MSELIQNIEELKSYLTTRKLCSKLPPKSVMVSGKIRKEFLTSKNQGCFIHNGCTNRIEFVPLGGGVYEAFIEESKQKK